MLLDELPELIDIINDIIPDSNTNFISDEETVDMYETCIYIMEEFMKENPKIISEPDFEDISLDQLDRHIAGCNEGESAVGRFDNGDFG